MAICGAALLIRSIAEGAGRDTDVEFAAELKKARAAGHDLEYNLFLMIWASG